jgi:hypothetical protein
MTRIVTTLFVLFLFITSIFADSLSVPAVDAFALAQKENTEKKAIIKKYPPYLDASNHNFVLRNQTAPFGKKVLRGSGLILAAQTMTTSVLYILPKDFSNWESGTPKIYRSNFKDAFTKAPVIDPDVWYINYVGHPYQGSYYYNAYRSQGAKVWQSALFSFGHSVFWEYMIESGFERPSVQDLIVTPAVGSLLGELFHFASIQMSHNGFKWYEAAFVSIFNPMFAINNGFKHFNVNNKISY